mmetsp:Transcript_40886/g.97877  ORF Transcript_40886/g.97877 Transcript_40886/m.97877 type:complete len:103 (-) Transcript_40886:143-451(-)
MNGRCCRGDGGSSALVLKHTSWIGPWSCNRTSFFNQTTSISVFFLILSHEDDDENDDWDLLLLLIIIIIIGGYSGRRLSEIFYQWSALDQVGLVAGDLPNPG